LRFLFNKKNNKKDGRAKPERKRSDKKNTARESAEKRPGITSQSSGVIQRTPPVAVKKRCDEKKMIMTSDVANIWDRKKEKR
jgi:hypothetical protein